MAPAASPPPRTPPAGVPRYAGRWGACFCGVALSLSIAGCSGLPGPVDAGAPEAEAYVREHGGVLRAALGPYVRERMDAYGAVGLSLALTDRDGLLWAEGFGYADRGARRRAGVDTVYPAGSLAKPLTAIAVVELAQAGQLDLDEALRTYLPEFGIRSRAGADTEGITLRRLLTHRAGLPSDLQAGMWTATPFTGVLGALGDETVAHPPGLMVSYSNLGYTLLGHLVQRHTGVPFAAHLEATLLGPLGLQHTGFGPTPSLDPWRTRVYRERRPMTPLPVRDVPAHGLHTSAADLARLARALLANAAGEDSPPLSAGLATQLFTDRDQTTRLDLGQRMGLGWFLETDSVPGAGSLVRHGGTTLYSAAELVLVPEAGLAVAVLSNSAGTRALVRELAEQILAAALGGDGDSPRPPATAMEMGSLVEGDGQYATTLGLLTVKPGEEALCACMLDQPLRLRTGADGWFRVRPEDTPRIGPALAALAEMDFSLRRMEGRDVLVGRYQGRELLLGDRVEPAPLPPAWRRRLGRYEVTNADPGYPVNELTLREEHGVICMSYRMPVLTPDTIRLPLRPASAAEAVVLGLGRNRGETLRAVDQNGTEYLRFSGLLARPVAGDGL